MRVSALLTVIALSGCALPRWPVEAPLTSPYGLRFFGLRPDIHTGVDLAVPTGTEVTAMTSGSVEFAGAMRGYGMVVILRHASNTRTTYAHLSKISVSEGEHVNGRQVLGLSGQSGNATGAHLHFEIERWGRPEDPVSLLGPPRH
jgi:murein DD-endopeptidase MepM/ murein hydrolase activator NlpD